MKPVDTTGAGDAFVSGLLNSLASDLTILTVLLAYLSLFLIYLVWVFKT